MKRGATSVRGKRQAARPLERLGPWAREEYHSFRRICYDASQLERLSPLIEQDLLRSKVAAAERELRKHTVYGWFKSQIPRAVSGKDDKTPFTKFRRLRVLVIHIPRILLPPAEPIRRNRQRDAAANAIRHVQESIHSGVLYFPDAAQEARLEELLTEAMQILQRPLRRLPKSVAYPSIQNLADELFEQTRTVDAQLLLDVAVACNLEDFNERAAQRYASTARGS